MSGEALPATYRLREFLSLVPMTAVEQVRESLAGGPLSELGDALTFYRRVDGRPGTMTTLLLERAISHLARSDDGPALAAAMTSGTERLWQLVGEAIEAVLATEECAVSPGIDCLFGADECICSHDPDEDEDDDEGDGK